MAWEPAPRAAKNASHAVPENQPRVPDDTEQVAPGQCCSLTKLISVLHYAIIVRKYDSCLVLASLQGSMQRTSQHAQNHGCVHLVKQLKVSVEKVATNCPSRGLRYDTVSLPYHAGEGLVDIVRY